MKEPSLSGFTFPAIEDCFIENWEQEVTDFVAAHPDRFVISYPGFGIFERSWVLRGFEEMLSDVALEAEFYQSLMIAITYHQLVIGERMLQTPLDVLESIIFQGE